MARPKERPRIRVAVLLRKEDQILLVQHHKYGATYWLLPGGGLEFGESLEECARREVLEETGIEIAVGDLIHVSESIPPDLHRHVVNLYFEGKVLGGDLKVGDDKALVGAEYVPIQRLAELDLRPPIRQELLDYLEDPAKSRPRCLGNRWNEPPPSSSNEEPAS